MTRSSMIAGIAAVVALSLSAAWAQAAPLARSAPVAPAVEAMADVGETAAPVIKVHGCHFDLGPNMAPDRANGPHYHNQHCAVVRVGPQRGYRERSYEEPRRGARQYDRGYDDWAPRRTRRAYRDAPPPQPVCRQQCRYVGPIKRCKTVCY